MSLSIDSHKQQFVQKTEMRASSPYGGIKYEHPNTAIVTSNSSVLGTIMRNLFVGSVEINRQKNMKELQKTFQDVFLKPNITLGEAVVMAREYQELNKIEDKNEYIKAVFELAKRNFGFGHTNIELDIVSKDDFVDNAIGGSDLAMRKVFVRDDIPRSHVINTIHHEFRHVMQKYLEYNLSPEDFMQAVNERLKTTSGGRCDGFKDINKFKDWMAESLNEQPSSDKVPQEYIEFARSCINATAVYKDVNEDKDAYYSNFLETDAYQAGSAIERVLRRVY